MQKYTITVEGEVMRERVEAFLKHPKEGALKIVESHSFYAGAVGIVPIPWIDAAGVSAIQLRMLYELTDYYGQRFSDHWGKEILSALLGGFGSTAASYGGLSAISRSIPLIGPIMGLITTPAVAATTTYALGSVFITFFENQGNFGTFDIKQMQQDFNNALNNKEVIQNLEAQKVELDELKTTISQMNDSLKKLTAEPAMAGAGAPAPAKSGK